MSEIELRDLRDKIGSTIFFCFSDESYKGTLYYADEINKRLTIQNVYDLKSNQPYIGFMEIFPADINSKKFTINTLNSSKIADKNFLREEKDKFDEQLLNTSAISILKDSFSQVVPLNKQISRLSLSSISNGSLNEEWNADNSSKRECSPNISTEVFPYGIISDFDSAISILDFQLKQSSKIGLREFSYQQNKLSLICLQCDEFIWCFDYLSIKSESNDRAKLFVSKIETILNDSKICKVFHNHHSLTSLFNIRIKNYIDLDTCYKQLYHDQFGQSIHLNSSLRRLIELYTDDFINERHYENLDWSKRPFSMHQKNVFTKETKYLIYLYDKYLDLKKSIKNLNLLVNVFEQREEIKKENGNSRFSKILASPKAKHDELMTNASEWTKKLNEIKEKNPEKSKYSNYSFRPAGCPLINPNSKKITRKSEF